MSLVIGSATWKVVEQEVATATNFPRTDRIEEYGMGALRTLVQEPYSSTIGP